MAQGDEDRTLESLGAPPPFPSNLFRHNIITLGDLLAQSMYDLCRLDGFLSSEAERLDVLVKWLADRGASLRSESTQILKSVEELGLPWPVTVLLLQHRLPTVMHLYQTGERGLSRLPRLRRHIAEIRSRMAALGMELKLDGGQVAHEPTQLIPAPSHRLFIDPFSQLENVQRWNQQQGWGFSQAELQRAAAFREAWPMAAGYAWVLTPFLRSFEQTYHALWNVIMSEGRGATRQDYGTVDAGVFRLIPGTQHTPGLHWVLVNLLYRQPPQPGRGETLPPVEERSDYAQAEVLAAAAHFPLWPRNTEESPFGLSGGSTLLAGYRMRTMPDGHESVPCLLDRDGRLHLSTAPATQAGTRDKHGWVSPLRLRIL